MRKRQNRIWIWLLLLIILAAVIGYLFTFRSNLSLGNIISTTQAEPKALVYLSDGADQQVLSHNLETGQETTLLDKGFGTLLSLNPSLDQTQALALIKKDSKTSLSKMNLKSGSMSDIGDVTTYDPKEAYIVDDSHYILVTGEQSDQIAVVDSGLKKDSEFSAPGEVTAVYPISTTEFQLAVFDGNSSLIHSYSDGKEVGDAATVDGQVYTLNDSNILYAKKITSDPDESNPVGKTYWKITDVDRKTGNETVLSEGNFDQNAVADSNFKYFAYQKKYDSSDQVDGRIFLISPDNKNDQFSSGTPLIFAY
jgi:hypothetical protein